MGLIDLARLWLCVSSKSHKIQSIITITDLLTFYSSPLCRHAYVSLKSSTSQNSHFLHIYLFICILNFVANYLHLSVARSCKSLLIIYQIHYRKPSYKELNMDIIIIKCLMLVSVGKTCSSLICVVHQNYSKM